MANITQVVAYNSTTRRFYATNPNDKISINQIPLSVQSGNGLVDNNGLYVPKIDTLTFSNDTITINMSDGTNNPLLSTNPLPDWTLNGIWLIEILSDGEVA